MKLPSSSRWATLEAQVATASPEVRRQTLQRELERLAPGERAAFAAAFQADTWLAAAETAAPQTPPSSFTALVSATADRAPFQTRRAISSFVAVPGLEADPSPSYAFIRWVDAQVAAVPALTTLHRQLTDLLKSSERPTRVAELYSKTIALARAGLGERTDLDPLERERMAAAHACVALAAQVMGVAGGSWNELPHFIPDARPGSFGFDATGHLICQCMFAYVTLFDTEHGDGALTKTFASISNTLDVAGRAAAIDAAYDRVRGRTGPLVAGALAGPPGAEETYFSRPIGMSEAEAAAYDEAVRLGSAYEHVTTPVAFQGYAPDALGEHPELVDPLAQVSSTIEHYAGLSDGNVTRDLTANRVGAFTAVQLFRSPAEAPHIPWDMGAQWQRPAYAPRQAIPLKEYFAQEWALLDRLLGPAAIPAPATPAEAVAHLRSRLHALVDRFAGDRDVLAKFYANFSVRQLRWRVPMGTPGLEITEFAPHEAYARRADVATLKHEFDLRLKAIEARLSGT